MRRLPVLTYHAIDDGPSPLALPPDRFRAQMAFLRDGGWRALTLDELLDGLQRGAWPAQRFVLTFDDGFVSMKEEAAPVLAACAFPALLFVVANYVGGTNNWPTQPDSVPRRPLLDWDDLRALASTGVEIGAHSMTHADLTRLLEPQARREIVDSKRVIQERIGRPVRAFAYPYGERSNEVEFRVAGHFLAAFGTELGYVTPGSQASWLERIDAYYLPARPALSSAPCAAYLLARRLARRARRAWRRRGQHG